MLADVQVDEGIPPLKDEAHGHNPNTTCVDYVIDNRLVMKNIFGRKCRLVFDDDYLNRSEEQLTRSQILSDCPSTRRFSHFRRPNAVTLDPH